MDIRPHATRIAVFGHFSFDLSSLELWRNGVKVRLEEKPARILAILIERAGVLVSREDLRSDLWPNGVHIDFDHGLNKSVNKLRRALGDSGSKPRFIETLSRRGYRFVAQTVLEPQSLEAKTSNPEGISTPADRPIPSDIPPQSVSLRRGVWKLQAAAVFALALLLTVGYFEWVRDAHRPNISVDHPRIAVLPFANLTGKPDQDYVCDGLTEEMIAQLSAVGSPRLAVIARTSSMHYKGSTKTAKQIAQELGADFILESSVRQAGARFRITTQLINSRTETHLWQKSYDRDLSDILDMHRAVAIAISRQIQLQISPDILASQMSQRVSPQAHEAYLRGRYAWNQRSNSSLHSAVDFFNQAIALDPTYAEAYSGLADTQAVLASSGGAPYSAAYLIAEKMARKAIALNPSSPEALASLAFVHAFYDWKFADAEAAFRRSIALDASYVTAHHWFGMYLSETGHDAEGIGELKLAHQLDPFSVAVGIDLADAYARARDDSEAKTMYLKMRDLDARARRTFVGIAILLAQEHKFAEAEAENKVVKELFGADAGIEDDLILEYVRAGDLHRAEAMFSAIQRDTSKLGAPCARTLGSCTVLGHKEETLKFLEARVEERADWMVGLKTNSSYESLHSDPRFQELLRRIGN
jgi:TolB-like protein/DNA-binding winged helix-turn-helix (wHTH) protein/Flp pilus assembly protein TadD